MKNDVIINDIEDAMTSNSLNIGGISLFEMTDAKRKANIELDDLLQKYLPDSKQQDKISYACSKISSVYQLEAFNAGFKLGARLMLEITEQDQ